MAASCCTAAAVPSISRLYPSGTAATSVSRKSTTYCVRARAESLFLPSDCGRLKALAKLRNVKVRAERDPFVEFSAAFVEDQEASGGVSDAERDAIIAFETRSMGGAVGEGDDQEEDSTGEDLWEERSAKDPRVDAPRPKQGKGAGIGNMLTVFLGLLERPFGGDGRMIAAAGGAVAERVEEEVEKLRGVEGVDEQYLFEIRRVVKLIEMDLQLVSAARREQTLMERLMQTAVHTKQALDIANSL